MTGPIEGPTGSGPIEPANEPKGPQRAEGVGREFDLSPAGETDKTPGEVASTQFDALRGIIQDGVNRGLGKDEILREIAGSELKGAFGESASRMTAEAVAEAVANDPNLSQMFSRLFAMASSGGEQKKQE